MIVTFEFWNTHDINGVICHVDGTYFKQKLMIDVNNVSYKYNIVEKGKTKDGKFTADTIVSYKTCIFQMSVPEYLFDSFNYMKNYDHIYIEDTEIGSIAIKQSNQVNGLIKVSVEVVVAVIKSTLDEVRLDKKYLKIDSSHNLLIGNGKKLIID